MKTVFHNFQQKSWIDSYYLQLQAVEDAKKNIEHVFFFEHKNVITLGTSSTSGDIPNTAKMRSKNISIFKTNRGGEATWHGVGQLVFYPILNIKKRRIRATELVKMVLQATQNALSNKHIETTMNLKKPGLYIQDKKIVSFGMTIKQGITMHGVSININNNNKGFAEINPCGMPSNTVSTIAAETGNNESIESIAQEVKIHLKKFL